MSKKMLCTIGYTRYMCDPHDAVLLLDVAARMIQVKQDDYRSPYYPDPDQTPFVDAFQLSDFVPDDPKSPEPATAEAAAEPLRITEQRKITHDDLPF